MPRRVEAGLPALLDVLAGRPQLVGEGLKDFVIALTCYEELGHVWLCLLFLYAKLLFRLPDDSGSQYPARE